MDNEMKETENVSDEHTLKKGRHRKKQLYNSILQQMEFYFSDSNLSKDRFLNQLLQQSDYVDLNVFLKFNKIRKLTSNIEDIQKAIKKSELIQLSEDKTSVCRKEPVKEKVNVDECTIYVERLKSDATHEWLSSLFSEFGTVVYVSIPKYKHNNVIKGFAFIEFDKESEAEKALKYFESIGCKMPSNTEPDQLCSITTFEDSKDELSEKKAARKKKFEEDNDEPKENGENVCEQKSRTASGSKRKFDEIEENNENGETDKKTKIEGGEVSESDDTEIKKKKKLKKEHKKKNYIKELGLQVLPKKEWKRMRNRYLDLQRKKMAEFKKHLHQAKYAQSNYEEKQKKANENNEPNDSVKLELVEGVIVKIKLPEPVSDIKKVKNEVRSLPNVLYVDIPHIGCEEIFVRCNSKEGAKNLCSHEFPGVKEVLLGEEEKSYWAKIQKDRQEKFNKTKKKQRGRDKLLKKAKHIKFDE